VLRVAKSICEYLCPFVFQSLGPVGSEGGTRCAPYGGIYLSCACGIRVHSCSRGIGLGGRGVSTQVEATFNSYTAHSRTQQFLLHDYSNLDCCCME
jgi:hypothetical protein